MSCTTSSATARSYGVKLVSPDLGAAPQGGDDLETLIYLPQHEKTRLRGDLGPLEIYHDGSVKIRPDHLFLAFTISERLLAPGWSNESSLYQIIIRNYIVFCRVIQTKL